MHPGSCFALQFIRYWATKGGRLSMTTAESVLSSAASMAVGFTEDTTPEILRRAATKVHARACLRAHVLSILACHRYTRVGVCRQRPEHTPQHQHHLGPPFQFLQTSVDCLVVCISKTGASAGVVAKYRPPCPVVVVSDDDAVLRQCRWAAGRHKSGCLLRGCPWRVILTSMCPLTGPVAAPIFLFAVSSLGSCPSR